ncbi:HAMP domain-containing sensor histidine kinase [Alteribacillus iranensis]|uniref:Signal transduction histidine-protein kinase ArlS n=1 Tax=Alteribacillus iranensis TaxID=930128 RepID=A0A1I2D2W0_9BACI|nr:HAMP domain-containing histidine kinase [Alteribacillus iranensis]SFE74849.1 Signal transduction histidine kinase [Alteribacillus iranensis]
MKLKSKLQLYSTLWMILLLIGANTAAYLLFHQFASQSEIERVQSQAESAAETIQTAEGMEPIISDVLRAFVPANGMIRVIDRDDSILHTVTKETRFSDLPFRYHAGEEAELFQSEAGETYAIIHRPVIWDNGAVVTLQVTEHLDAFETNMDRLMLVLFASSLIILLPTLIGGRLLGEVFLRPIRALVRTMNEVQTTGEWKKIDLHRKSKDEIYEMGAAFNHMIRRLSDNFEKQKHFVSDASHELRTPLSIIDSYARLLKRWGAKKPDVLEESLEAIVTETDRMKKISDQLLTLARSEEAEALEITSFDIASVCKQTVHSFSTSFQRTITLDAPEKEVIIEGDESKVKQALYILLDNAVKYTEQDIHVRLKEEGHHILLSVQDEGEGIPDSDQKHIFDRFYRVDKARSRSTGGSGLGLPIAKQLIRLHNGDVTLDSKPGQGSTFTIRLPVVQS